MKKITKWLLVAIIMVASTAMFSQGKLTGVVKDDNGVLPGASVIVKGTSVGTTTDFDGKFTLDVKTAKGTLEVSFLGYTTRNVSFNVASGTKDLGTILLETNSESLSEIVVTATSFAIDRKTPVAVSTIKSIDIENKLGTQEFPEILKSTPGVYATKSGGGFGDGRLNLRGFGSANVAVMINGVPVNDMENGWVYWSNWAGLADVTSAMQTQRGLGASKVAVPSIGGTVNILSKTTDIAMGGLVNSAIGNDGYQKYGATISTGLLDNGLAITASAARTKGDGYVDGTQFDGYNYFLNISKQINDNNKISFTTFGAPQRHGQRQNRHTIADYRNAQSGRRFNSDWGYKNGQVVSVEDNFYHKSQSSLNHYWTINSKSDLSTALYASWGTGGGGGQGGNASLFNVRLGGYDQPMDLDNIVDINRAQSTLGAVSWLRASRNDHSWYGLLSTYKNSLNEHLDMIVGIDLRNYTGHHFTEVTDLLGATFVNGGTSRGAHDVNHPNALLKVGDKYSYYDDGKVGWQGLFTQFEYNKEKVSTFVSASLSNTSYQRVDFFNYLDSDPLQKTDKYNFTGYGLKGGANINVSAKTNFFANIGYFEKAAGFDAVFQGFDNEHINKNAPNQKIFSTEIGYGFRGEKFAANVNVYRTEWNDRTFTRTFQSGGVTYFANLLGVNALHKGIEFDFNYRPSTKLKMTGMLSLGNWKWNNNIENAQVVDENQQPVRTYNLYIKGLRVSDAAQTTAALGFDYEMMKKTFFTLDINYFADLYADYNPDSRTVPETPQPWKVPSYGTADAGLRYGFKFGSFDATIIARINNVFNTEYIADAVDGSANNADTALVWYGFGRTFNVSAKIKF